MYTTNHPSGGAHGGSAIIVKSNIKHYPIDSFCTAKIQASHIKISDGKSEITVSAIYCPPRHSITFDNYKEYLTSLGNRFICGGDWNAKHTYWGSRLINPKGRQLYRVLGDLNLECLSTGQPTYWPTDRARIPDLMDFFVTKNFSLNNLSTEQIVGLSSDPTPIVLNVNRSVILTEMAHKIYNRHTSWAEYQNIISCEVDLKIPLKNIDDIELAIERLNMTIHLAAAESTSSRKTFAPKEHVYPAYIKDKIQERRRLRKIWHNTRYPKDKANFNKCSEEVKTLIKNMKNENLQAYLRRLTPTRDTNYSLWKATSKLKRPKSQITPINIQPGLWARSDSEKADAFAEHLKTVFQPLPSTNQNHDCEIEEYLRTPIQMCPPLKSVTPRELLREIRGLQDCKAPGYDQIDATLLKNLPRKGLMLLLAILNACLRLSVFPAQWKIAQVVMISKPGKPPKEVTSYRPISLLPIPGKLLEKIILTRMRDHLKDIIPKHQFGFRQGHGTIEQIHRLVDIIYRAFENKQYCSAIFLDISQAFDKVWHSGLLYKIKQTLPHSIFQIVQSYLEKRCFEVKYNEEVSQMQEIQSGVPQGSILGPVLYLIFTADLPTADETTDIATYADDTALLSVHENPDIASRNLQTHLSLIEVWFSKWRIKANKDKSAHVTFTLRKKTCPPVSLYNEEIPQAEDAKYLGMHLDRRLTWQKHIWAKRKQLSLKIRSMYWLIGRKSQLTDSSKMVVYKSIIKPIWTYGIQLWGSASHSNIEILERFQNKTIRNMLNVSPHVSNKFMYLDIKLNSVKQEIESYSRKYQIRLDNHKNDLAAQLQGTGSLNFSRLKRHGIPNLAIRFANPNN